jgi:hypothetical protein
MENIFSPNLSNLRNYLQFLFLVKGGFIFTYSPNIDTNLYLAFILNKRKENSSVVVGIIFLSVEKSIGMGDA